MGAGRIVNTNSVSGEAQVKIMTGSRHAGSVEVIGGTNAPAKPVEINFHNEVVIPGQGNVHLKKDGTPDLRFRNAPNREAWNKIKRGDWEN